MLLQFAMRGMSGGQGQGHFFILQCCTPSLRGCLLTWLMLRKEMFCLIRSLGLGASWLRLGLWGLDRWVLMFRGECVLVLLRICGISESWMLRWCVEMRGVFRL